MGKGTIAAESVAAFLTEPPLVQPIRLLPEVEVMMVFLHPEDYTPSADQVDESTLVSKTEVAQ